MLKMKLIHPDILYTLGKAGHGAKVLIADADYPVSTTGGRNARVIHLNLAPGQVNSTQVLEAILSAKIIEAAEVMDVPTGQTQPRVWDEFKQIMQDNGYDMPFTARERFEFYKTVREEDTALIIATGDQREYANLLLTIGSL
ncbi:RbsD/FucU family protein [Paenibacillus sp. N3.4]|uniref:RbsD/FucU family protein n=1 Tax=Paenibacillus sp. N3.4 TaxID=2603222 RepID=UPI0011CB4F68|nr:RbsD/FucU family protein [Paenibacillus sp. N3.4]TXK71259.1 RbsD or FucU transport [Paenibacillus sp. N3.4]